jgi:hypothetical protein
MDVVRKNNTVKMTGNLEVKEQVTANNLTVNGVLTVNGKQLGLEAPTNQVYIGDQNADGSWKLELVDGELVFSQKNGTEWVVKQTLS